MANGVKTKCCGAVLEKSLYLAMLVEDNRKSDNSRHHHHDVDSVKCICGKTLDRKDLGSYFSGEEIDDLFAQIQGKASPSKPSPEKCKSPVQSKNPSKVSDAEPAISVLVRNEEEKKFAAACCKTAFGSLDAYLADFAARNLEKKNKGESISEDRMLCPTCDKIFTRYDLEKAYGKTATDHLIEHVFAKVCGECKCPIAAADICITNADCGHMYHLLCAQYVCETGGRQKTCKVPGCHKELYAFSRKIEQELEKCCCVCLKVGQRFAVLKCKHFICLACAEGFRRGENSCIRHEKEVNVDCGVCKEGKSVDSIVLSCEHSMRVKKMQEEVRDFVRAMERSGIVDGIRMIIQWG